MLEIHREVSSVNKEGPFLCGEKVTTIHGASGRRHSPHTEKESKRNPRVVAFQRTVRTVLSYVVTGVTCSDVTEGREAMGAFGPLLVPAMTSFKSACVVQSFERL